jgi:V/A-type H+-transporting ATPase subunit F
MFVLGNADAVLGFSLAGVEGAAVASPPEALVKLEELRRRGDVGLVLVTSDLARQMHRQLGAFGAASTLPIVLEVAAPGEVVERAAARELLRRAAGIGV